MKTQNLFSKLCLKINMLQKFIIAMPALLRNLTLENNYKTSVMLFEMVICKNAHLDLNFEIEIFHKRER